MRSIFITGASKGLGLEFTKQYLEKRESVIATCRVPEKAYGLQELSSDFPHTLTIEKLDVTKEEERSNLYERIKNDVRQIDILINNAGIIAGDEVTPSTLGSIFKEDFGKVMEVNSIAPLLISEKFLPLLEQAPSAKIVNISSQNGSIAKRSVGGKYSYAASKAALNMITRILSNDLRERKIVTLAIHPGWIKTDMGGSEAPLQIEEPISMIIDLIDRATMNETGKFLDWKGNEVPW